MSKQKRYPIFQSIAELMAAARQTIFPRERMQVPKRQSRYTYVDGPMYYLGQHIVKAMEDSGHAAKIIECYRSPERQSKLKKAGRSRAGPYQSPHQYYEAVDIIHPSIGWDVSPEYWETLSICVQKVADQHGIKLNHGHHWAWRDSAHIELEDWRDQRQLVGNSMPTEEQLWQRFAQILPDVAAAYMRR